MEKSLEKVIFELPLYIDIPISERARSEKNLKRIAAGKPYTRYWFNMNVYRNLHHHLEVKMKSEFRPLSIPEYFQAEQIRITYHINRNGRTSFDTMNVISIVDKYFLDWMVICGYLPDDSFKNVSYGGITGENQTIESKVIAEVEIIQFRNKSEKKVVQQDLFS